MVKILTKFTLRMQKKLEDELSQLDARFEARKRKFMEDSEKFRRELKRVSK